MNRKNFLTSISLLSAAIPTLGLSTIPDIDPFETILPPSLHPSDTIAITCPSGYITLQEIQPALQQLQSWGFNIKLGDTINKRYSIMGGTDEERRADLQRQLDDPHIKAIMFARGGYGAIRIIDQLNFTKFKAKPKWIIGFSDATVFHCHLNRKFGIASIHSKMCNSFPDNWMMADPIQKETIISIQKALRGDKMQYQFQPNEKNRKGTAEGPLIGGNLKLIESLAGSASDIKTAGKILFVEDTGEYLYSIDRMFWNLARSGKLAQLKGLIIGGFRIKLSENPAEEFGETLQEIVMAKVKPYTYPVCFDFPVGHQKNNYALKCGVRHKLVVNNDYCSLTEIR